MLTLSLSFPVDSEIRSPPTTSQPEERRQPVPSTAPRSCSRRSTRTLGTSCGTRTVRSRLQSREHRPRRTFSTVGADPGPGHRPVLEGRREHQAHRDHDLEYDQSQAAGQDAHPRLDLLRGRTAPARAWTPRAQGRPAPRSLRGPIAVSRPPWLQAFLPARRRRRPGGPRLPVPATWSTTCVRITTPTIVGCPSSLDQHRPPAPHRPTRGRPRRAGAVPRRPAVPGRHRARPTHPPGSGSRTTLPRRGVLVGGRESSISRDQQRHPGAADPGSRGCLGQRQPGGRPRGSRSPDPGPHRRRPGPGRNVKIVHPSRSIRATRRRPPPLAYADDNELIVQTLRRPPPLLTQQIEPVLRWAEGAPAAMSATRSRAGPPGHRSPRHQRVHRHQFADGDGRPVSVPLGSTDLFSVRASRRGAGMMASWQTGLFDHELDVTLTASTPRRSTTRRTDRADRGQPGVQRSDPHR